MGKIKDEKILKKIKPSHWAYLGWYLLGFLTLPFFGLGFLLIIFTFFLRGAHTFYLTDKKVIHEFTFLSRKISSAPYEKIQDLHLTQNIIERILNIGTLYLNTAGTSKMEIKLFGIENPEEIKKVIETKIINSIENSA
ncbi:PH domain-containing protein [bacterium]|nr:PH domain-containing protein [bacterium]